MAAALGPGLANAAEAAPATSATSAALVRDTDGYPAEAVRAWFATAPEQRAAPAFGGKALTAEDARRWGPRVVEAGRDGARALGWDRWLPVPVAPVGTNGILGTNGVLALGTNSMPYVVWAKGAKPKDGWPLYIALHGGGGNARATGPHAWDVNTREWQAQQRLTERVYPAPGLYFIPRMADDRKGRWYAEHNQQAFDQVIRAALLFHDVNPDRVYLLGISEGGYGAIRFAGNRPDRFAALNGMAAAEPLDTSPPENMRNVGLRIDIGEQDTMFDRVGLARRMGARLEELKREDPSGYDFSVAIQPGRGHGIRYQDGPAWIASRVRRPWPDRVNWTVRPFDRQVSLQQYWLALPEKPVRMPLFLTATLRSNALAITAETLADDKKTREPATAGRLLVRLNEQLADLDAPVSVTVNGRALPPIRPVRRLETMVRTLGERSDARFLFPVELEVPLGPDAGR